MSENNVAIEIENLTKTYTDFRGRPKAKALKDLSLSIKKGEVFGLLGPNGSGKTTTIKLLLGLIFPTSGTAKVLGKPATDVSVKHSIGFLPEESYLYKFLDAEETLEFYGQIFGMKKAARKAKADELIKRLGLDYARKRQVKEYSKGMARRIGFAQALINDPEVLFLDEPTSGLDPIGTREMKDLILQLKSEGKTILLSSHLLADVQDVCDRIAILHLGTLRKLGPVKDLLKIKDVLQVTLAGLDDEGRDRVANLLAEHAEILDMSHPSESLEDLFLKTIQENPRDGDQESYRQEWGRKVDQIAPGSVAKKESAEDEGDAGDKKGKDSKSKKRSTKDKAAKKGKKERAGG